MRGKSKSYKPFPPLLPSSWAKFTLRFLYVFPPRNRGIWGVRAAVSSSHVVLLLLPCQWGRSSHSSSTGSLPWETVLHERLQCASFPRAIVLNELIQHGSLPSGAVLQKQIAPAWFPCGISCPISKPAPMWSSLQRATSAPRSLLQCKLCTASHPTLGVHLLRAGILCGLQGHSYLP